MGPPGVGKSHLAVALGVMAIRNGFSTTHFVLDDLMHVLKGDAAVPPRRLRAKRYPEQRAARHRRSRLPAPRPPGANLFFRLVSARYEKGSISLTSNKHVLDWPEASPATRSSPPRSSTACYTTYTSSTSTAAATGSERSTASSGRPTPLPRKEVTSRRLKQPGCVDLGVSLHRPVPADRLHPEAIRSYGPVVPNQVPAGLLAAAHVRFPKGRARRTRTQRIVVKMPDGRISCDFRRG